MLDVDKAFDSLWVDGILYKMLEAKLPTKLIRFFANFLKGRSLRVKMGTARSRWIEMCAGSPQGAILSPDIFLFFSADMPLKDDTLESSSLYADDSCTWCITASLELAQRRLQENISALEKWFLKWRLLPAASKSTIVVFSRRTSINAIDKLLEVKLMDEKIPVVKEAKFLGVVFDRRANWSSYIDELIKKATEDLRHPKADEKLDVTR